MRSNRRNISDAERRGSMAAGVAMTLYGANRLTWFGAILAVSGALLFRRGATGYCHTYHLLGIDRGPAKAGRYEDRLS
jgi:uncharacterized membrane protein